MGRAVLLLAIASLIGGASVALAAGQGASITAYGGSAGNLEQAVVSHKGTLPFTGTSLALFVIVGIVLLAVGLVLRRRAAARD
jgi:LPXTG-motif cell wall-anchored protein